MSKDPYVYMDKKSIVTLIDTDKKIWDYKKNI